MDILAHALWTNAVFYKKYKNKTTERVLAVLFGILPDLISFAPVVLYSLVYRASLVPKNYIAAFSQPTSWVYGYAVNSYNFTHSLVVFAAVFLIVTVARKGRVYWPLLGWALHIVIDIFTHTDFFPTPFLFPLSKAHNHYAVSWAELHFMVINYFAIILVYVIIYLYGRRQKNSLTV